MRHLGVEGKRSRSNLVFAILPHGKLGCLQAKRGRIFAKGSASYISVTRIYVVRRYAERKHAYEILSVA